jgi:hypothetical protein
MCAPAFACLLRMMRCLSSPSAFRRLSLFVLTVGKFVGDTAKQNSWLVADCCCPLADCALSGTTDEKAEKALGFTVAR